MSGRVVHVNDARPDPVAPQVLDLIHRGVLATLAEGSPSGSAPDPCEVSVTLVDAARMRDLNASYHGVDAPTDVLAFDLGARGPGLLGDIYLCVDVAAEAAGEGGEPLETELARLAIHGTLHLLGHDHPDDEERWDSPMFRLQEGLLDRL